MTTSGDRFTDIDLENKSLSACYGYITWKVLPIEEAMKDLHKLLPEINQFAKLAKKHCKHPNNHKLSKDEAAAIYIYTMEMAEDACVYRILNQTLRAEDRSKARPWFGYLKLLHSATSKLPKYKGIVYRGIDKDVSMAFKKGQRITWWSVSSCSASVDVISSFFNKARQSTLFNIECSSGKSISGYTCYPKEDEVILMPGTVFEVVAHPLHHHGVLHIIHLKEIADDDDNNSSDDEKQGAYGSTTAFVPQKISKIRSDSDKPTHFATNASTVPKNTMVPYKPLSKPQPQPKAEYHEFDDPNNDRKLDCKGRPCAKCHMCRDWQFGGDHATWTWIANWKIWTAKDWNHFNNDGIWKNFKKRDGATCSYGFYGGGYGYYGGRGDDGGGFYGSFYFSNHLCVCERH
ncbi:unnamed protein product [Adineta steineri]|uniref:NAD(P)(+)--arginine ADP-ribosyltransferase n=1 Tax=Adineta steineri TaxID=433720 RepID=A0A819PQQ7_9BILA|nr:unnamed protein product [Adineta steineri]